MKIESSVEIDAADRLVWDVFSDVERWPEWTDSVNRLVALDGPGIALGKRFEIFQPRLPRLVWEVTAVVVGASWTWTSRSPGGRTVARHEVMPLTDDRTLVRQEIDHQGAAAVVGWLMRPMTKRYLELEGRGLKARTEQPEHLDGPTT